MKILFMGTPEPAAKCLQALVDSGENVVAVFTQPDRPQGRGLKVGLSAVKELAQKLKLPIHQPEKIKDRAAIDLVNNIDPELIVVVAYGKILPKEIIEYPKYGSINVHASLLPKYRGAAPVQWALLNGEKETGITVQKVFEALDSGDIILQKTVAIDEADNTRTLMGKLFDLGAPLLVETVKLIEKGAVKPVKQDEKRVILAPSLTKETGLIDWKEPTRKILNKVRGCYPWPSAYTLYNEKMLKVLSASSGLATHEKQAGTVIDCVEDEGFIVATGDGSIFIREVQLEGGKRMHAWQFLNGHKLSPGDILPN